MTEEFVTELLDDETAQRLVSDARSCRSKPKPTIVDMRDTVNAIAHQIESTERALLRARLRSAPSADRMRSVAILDALGSFLDAVISRPGEVARRLNAQQRGNV